QANRAWHERARVDHPDWPAVPEAAYYALAGATAELVRSKVSQGRTQTVTELEDTLVALHLAVLAGQPWPQPGTCDPAHRPECEVSGISVADSRV
ncbi:MAG: hypothetical protein ACRDNZ_02520, partial [Streptosporangiaceae bacterium]